MSTRTALYFYSTVAFTQVRDFRPTINSYFRSYSAAKVIILYLAKHIFYTCGYVHGYVYKKSLVNAFIPQKKQQQIFCLSRINECGCLKTDSITITNTVFSSSFLCFFFFVRNCSFASIFCGFCFPIFIFRQVTAKEFIRFVWHQRYVCMNVFFFLLVSHFTKNESASLFCCRGCDC